MSSSKSVNYSQKKSGNFLEEIIGAEESNFRNFFNDIDDFLFVLDLEGNIIETNQAVLRILGYTKEELVGQSVLMVHPPEYRQRAGEIIGQMLSGEAEKCPLPLLSKLKTHVPVETRVYEGVWNSQKVLIGVSRNLSELALSEEKFYNVFNNSDILMALSEIDSGVFVHVNRKFLDVLGYSESEVIGQSSRELDMYYDTNLRNAFLEKLSRNKSVENERMVVKTKNGELLHCLFSIKKIQIQTQTYWLTSADNITDLMVAKEKLMRNLKQQTLLADISKKLNSFQDFDKNMDEVLKMLGEHAGISRVYVFENDPTSIMCSNTYEWCNVGITPQKDELQDVPWEMIPSWKKILDEQGKVLSYDITELPDDVYQLLEPQGIKSILVFALHVHEKFFGFIGFDECVTHKVFEIEEIELLRTISNMISGSFERLIFQKKLTESEARLNLAIDNSETGLWDWNIITGQVYFNDIWCKMLGYDKSDVEPHISSWERLVHPDDMPYINEELNKHLKGETSSYQSLHRLLTKKGEWKWILDKGRVVERDVQGNPLRAIGAHFDIDEQKNAENELQKANENKDKFFSIIGHDLRGSIGSIMQMSEMLAEKGSVDEETLYTSLESQKEISRAAYNLLENLLNWAKSNRDQMIFKPGILNINNVIKDCIFNVKVQAESKKISLKTKFDQEYDVYADEDMTRLIIRNLLSNAMNFTPENGSITFSLSSKNDFVSIKIKDTGMGMIQENIEKVLSDNEFHSTYGTDYQKGSGLGIKLCKNFIHQNHGSIAIESVVRKGTTVKVKLPGTKACYDLNPLK
jgi:PAS domain S-box-containing protein